MNMKRILVAASLSSRHDAAFKRGLTLARASGAELHLLHAVPAHEPFSVGAKERLERRAELLRRAEDAGVTARAVEQHGDPAAIIELHANAYAVDLIVLGTGRKATWLRRPSVTERVLHRTTRPTLIVPSNDDAIAAFGHVLVAMDLTPETNELVDRAIQLAGSGSPRVTVVHAVKGIEAADAVQSPARWKIPEYPYACSGRRTSPARERPHFNSEVRRCKHPARHRCHGHGNRRASQGAPRRSCCRGEKSSIQAAWIHRIACVA